MSDVILSIEVDTDEAEAYFDYAGYHARDMRDPLEAAVHEIIIPGIEYQFDTEGARVGGWKPLSAGWLTYKATHGYAMDILQMSGWMRLDAINLGDAPPYRVTMDTLEYEPNDEKFVYHQIGDERGTGRPPQRQILVWTADDDERLEEIFIEWLDGLRESNIRRGDIDPDIVPSAPSNIFILE